MLAQSVHILMVEDNPGDARLLQEYLAEGLLTGYDITHCSRLRDALTYLDAPSRACDVILLDLSLPDSSGLDTFLAVAAKAADVPIVILSGFNDATLACQAVQKGAQDYIPKDSLDGSQLARTIRYAIERKQWEETNRRREERIGRLEKMEAIGRLSGGIAHNFNNILTAIIGNCELLRPRVVGDPKALRHAEAIQWAAQRASMLTRELLAFACRQQMRPQLVEVNYIIRDLEPLLRGVISKDITFDFDLAADLGTVLTDPAQMEQVVMNLVLNARDAMPAGGRIALRTRIEHLSQPKDGQPDSIPAGTWVTLAIQDDGQGIDSAVIPRIFEPFFTTKEGDKSTGLGLSTVFGIVQQNKGHIHVESAAGAGTTFTIYLQRQDQKEATPTKLESSEAQRGSETILLVDDEAHVSSILAEVLTENGYRVLTTASGEQAITLLSQRGDSIDLVITDLKMPGINGYELARRIRATHPDMKVVLISGHVDDTMEQERDQGGISAFLPKPFTSQVLTKTIRDVFKQAAAAAK
ncbi:MAG: response regulator [Planctomycetes bacterium]|nr:response regulator [Planctomycetota bacterium]